MVMPVSLITKETTSWDDAETTDAQGNPVQSDLWTLTYVFRGVAGVNLTAAANGKGWRTTTLLNSFVTPGKYFWQALLTKGSPTVTDRILLNSGSIIVKQNLADATNTFDGSSQAQKDLVAVQAAIRALSLGGAKSYTIGNRSLTKLDVAELIALETRLKGIIQRENKAETIASGLGDPNNLFVRFGKS